MPIKVVIMGAAGTDFHVFNCLYRDNEQYKVVAFTAAQIPDIGNRKYPASLAGNLYPEGIPIKPEKNLPEIIEEHDVDEVILAYHDLSFDYVMHKANWVNYLGPDFKLVGVKNHTVPSKKPVLSVCAVRTGAGKSQAVRYISKYLKDKGFNSAVVRHPMPYGDLEKMAVQRFDEYSDLEKENCTIEEREEYEPEIAIGNTVFAGVDYHKILEQAEKAGDLVLWEGGNNDFSFYKPDLHIVIADPLRAGDEIGYHPTETSLRMADAVVINKENSATDRQIKTVTRNVRQINPNAKIIHANSTVTAENPDEIKGKEVLVIEDGPTITHGGMSTGAGYVAAKKYGAKKIIDPKPFAVGSVKKAFEDYPHIGKVLPALGYSKKQIQELEQTIKNSSAELILAGTPIDLKKIVDVNTPIQRIDYELAPKSDALNKTIDKFIQEQLKDPLNRDQ